MIDFLRAASEAGKPSARVSNEILLGGGVAFNMELHVQSRQTPRERCSNKDRDTFARCIDVMEKGSSDSCSCAKSWARAKFMCMRALHGGLSMLANCRLEDASNRDDSSKQDAHV